MKDFSYEENLKLSMENLHKQAMECILNPKLLTFDEYFEDAKVRMAHRAALRKVTSDAIAKYEKEIQDDKK